MNSVCTNIIHMTKSRLYYYSVSRDVAFVETILNTFMSQGNYDTYIRTRVERLENQMKRYNWEQSQLQHMKDYIARFGHGSKKLARQAQSKEKTMAKMIAGGLTEKHVAEKVGSLLLK